MQRLGQLARLTACLAAAVVAAAPAPAPCAEVPEASLTLEVVSAAGPGQWPEAAPPRFVLLEDGSVYVGGSSRVAAGRLDRAEVKEIDGLVSRVRKLPGLGSQVTLGPGATRYRLQLRKGPTITASGGLGQAPPQLQPLVALLGRLAAFHHPSLQPYEPASYALLARVGTLTGGCRAWTLPVPPSDALAGGRALAAEAARGWPTGATAASVCSADKAYVVALRPLLPGEKP